MDNIFEEIRKERKRQDEKWGVQNHSPLVWDSILNEEAGEVSKAALESYFTHMGSDDLDDYRKELIEVAATAVAAIQCLDNNEWNWDMVSQNIRVNWKKIDYSHPDGYPDSETGEVYEVLTKKGIIYVVRFMDWGAVINNSTDTIEELGDEIEYYRKIS